MNQRYCKLIKPAARTQDRYCFKLINNVKNLMVYRPGCDLNYT